MEIIMKALRLPVDMIRLLRSGTPNKSNVSTRSTVPIKMAGKMLGIDPEKLSETMTQGQSIGMSSSTQSKIMTFIRL